jgi:predicted MFS family arabinose efflux permease
MIAKKGRRFRVVGYAIEGLNSFAVVTYFTYLYFLMRSRFGFDDKDNLTLAAALGFLYIFVSWQAGRFAQRCGYFTALKLGFTVMALALAAGSQLNSAPGQIFAAFAVATGMCFTWPTLEALTSEGETPADLPRAVGIYNVVWASTAALAFFLGGTLIETFGFKSIFFVPIAIQLIQLALTFWLQRHADELARAGVNQPVAAPPPDPNRPPPAETKTFLRMAWLANPFAYIAINTLIAVLPGLAAKFQLSPMFAGFACSLWCFARLGAFFALWFWTGWHYRFRWLAAAFVTLIVSFAVILAVPDLKALLVAQIFFGLAIGLIYYSSLFYSMDAGDAKGDHGGIHEAAIGLGNCVGPGVGAASLQFFPQYTHNGVLAVSTLLSFGLLSLVAVRWRARSRR